MKHNNREEVFIKMVLSAWDTHNTRLAELLESLTDEQLSREIAPGKNSGVYLLGHLAAIGDAMLPLLEFGDRIYPHLDKVFVDNPDKSGLVKPPVRELRECLKVVTQKLSEGIKATSVDEWFNRHTIISPEDFEKEPHRNKLNVIINRTSHMANHYGQLLLLKSTTPKPQLPIPNS